jgi:hypothetical protein
MEMTVANKGSELGMFDKRNDRLRLDVIDAIRDDVEVPLMAFTRQLGAPHLYAERLLPMAKAGESTLLLAVSDRQWPPWGLGARTVHALCQVHRIGDHSFGISPVLTLEDDLTNIGLQTALYKEALEHSARANDGDVNYLVAQGSVLGDRVLRRAGFERTEDFLLNDHARYHAYRAKAKAVLAHLGLDRYSTPDLLAHQIDEETFERNALLQSTLQLAMRPGLLASAVWRHEILVIDSPLAGAALPGGVNVSGRVVLPGGPITRPGGGAQPG